MTSPVDDKIIFQVETDRVLQILSKEIYDSPLALLRENVQNAYDAILMAPTYAGDHIRQGLIEVRVEPRRLMIKDNGIGMTEEVLRNHFWKTGSSGKRTDLAKQAGVVGTFGIGAMANFGVCSRLRVETRAIGMDTTLISTAERSRLTISANCIDLEKVKDDRSPGTLVIADLDESNSLAETSSREYLHQYVRYAPVRVLLNDSLISQESYTERNPSRPYTFLGTRRWCSDPYSADVTVHADSNGQVLAILKNIRIQETPVLGDLLLIQGAGQLMGLRNYFGLAPVPVGGSYQLGGVANLLLLQPTAGREALSRDSIDHVNRLVNIAEAAITEVLSRSEYADRNTAFLQYISAHRKFELAGRVAIEVLPENKSVELGEVAHYCKGKSVYYYTGRDQQLMQTFAHESSVLLHVSQLQPRRQAQLGYITSQLHVEQVPDRAMIVRQFKPTDLTLEEVAMLAQIGATLAEDYLLSNVDIGFAEISHGVVVLVDNTGGVVCISLARTSSAVRSVLQTYRTANEVFRGFVKDFVRNQLYPRIKDFVPSSTREGADALFRILQRNRELYRYEETDLGSLEPLLGEYLAGNKTLSQVIATARSTTRPQVQRVTRTQMGSLEQAMPDVVGSPSSPDSQQAGREYEAAPPILRTDISCELKMLVTMSKHPQLNSFELFLGLSDKLRQREGEFFLRPHTTKAIWAGHRIIYIFTEASGELNLYYDIELKEPLAPTATGGGMLPTTTLITKNRIFIPVPEALDAVFRISEGVKEFYVRFDTI